MIYKPQQKIPFIHFCCDDFRNQLEALRKYKNLVIVTDPPFNIGYHYGEYKDKMNDAEYWEMLAGIVKEFPAAIIHYPEALHRLSIEAGKAPERVCAWVYNSNTAKQHRDVAFYGITPDFTKTLQEYKNPNDKRIKERIARGIYGGRMYDWWNVNQVKNVSKDKTKHPCQMPLEIMKNIISTLPEESVICDPFMGSGTTAMACIELGYDFIGCEIDREYFEIAKERINASQEEGQ